MYIGKNKIKETKESGQTVGGVSIIEITYEEGGKQYLSKLMYDKIVSKEQCDDSMLRDKRIAPVVEVALTMLRDWGIRLDELPYFSAMLDRSIEFNRNEAANELWREWVFNPKHPEEVDMIAIDRVLKAKKKTIQDVVDGK